jgi:hypothetical protein
MSRQTVCFLTLLWTTAIVGSLAAAQDPAEATPNYEISHPDYQYDSSVASIADVDFKNITVFWHRSDKPEPSARLLKGTFARKYEHGGGEEVTLDFVKFINLQGETEPRAVIDILWRSCGGSCSESGLVQVFELRSGRPVVVEQITYERHAPDTGAKLETGSRILTVTGRSSEPSPNCCPKSLDVMTFEWDGKEFIFKSSNRVALADTP